MRFDMVGMDVGRIQVLHGLRMFAMRGFVLGTFTPGLGCLRTFSMSNCVLPQWGQVALWSSFIR